MKRDKTKLNIPVSYEIVLSGLPKWAKWIAVNRDGSIWGFEHKPTKYKESFFWTSSNPDDESKILLDTEQSWSIGSTSIVVLYWEVLNFEIEKLDDGNRAGSKAISIAYEIELDKLPEQTNWITVDEDGSIWFFNEEPIIKADQKFWLLQKFNNTNSSSINPSINYGILLSIQKTYYFQSSYIVVQDWELKKFNLSGSASTASNPTNLSNVTEDYEEVLQKHIDTIKALRDELALERDRAILLKNKSVFLMNSIDTLKNENKKLIESKESMEFAMAEMEKDILNLYNEIY